jgi:AcrR family transcriptional regulator
MGMSIPYESSGRTRQKLRTRDALIAATRALITRGVTPRVEDAAARAEISRTTAYRYFPNQRALLIAAHPEIDRKSLLSSTPSRDPAARLDAVLDEFIRIMLETEPQLRMALRLSLETGPTPVDSPLRSGRAIGWLEDALAPVAARLSKREMRRLVYAIRSAAGIEALVWLTDVARLSRAEAAETMKWSAQALLRAALAGGRRRGSRR